MKRAPSLFAITISLSVLSLPAAAPAPSHDFGTVLSDSTFTSFLSYDDLKALAATSTPGKVAAKQRIAMTINNLKLPTGTSTVPRAALAKISLIQEPYTHALVEAVAALTGKSLTKARELFYSLPEDDERIKMAYRYTWWKQDRSGDNLDETVNLGAVFNDFNDASDYKLNFAPLHGLPHDNKLAQLIIDLVLCSPKQNKLHLQALPSRSSIAITSCSLNALTASFNTGLTTLDLSNNPALTYLNASNTGLTTLNLNHNPALTCLQASNNPGLITLDLSNNPNLAFLQAYNNQNLIEFRIRATREHAAVIADINAMVAANRARSGLPAA